MKLVKGFTYLVKTERYWYIVQQTGQRSWDAIVFSHVTPFHDEAYYHGNSSDLTGKMPVILESYPYNSNTGMRKDMFSILKYGEIRHE